MQFAPRPEIRNLDLTLLEGKTCPAELLHTDESERRTTATNQYVKVDTSAVFGNLLHVSGWIGCVLGQPGTKLELTVREAWLVTHANGGRDNRRAKTYAEFFDHKHRLRVQEWRSADLLSRIGTRRGDPDRCDVQVSFTNGCRLDSLAFDIEAPKEWYSEQHAGDPRFRFVDGFFDDASQAIEHFRTQPHDDLFGERRFPVLVFPAATDPQKIQDVIWRPKVTSDAIVVGDQIVYGTRCKPAEYAETIEQCYEAGGRVARNLEWDW